MSSRTQDDFELLLQDTDFRNDFKSEPIYYRYKKKPFLLSSYLGGPNVLEHLHDPGVFPVRRDDVFIASFPKSGSTWVQEIVWLLRSDLDYLRAHTEFQCDRVGFLDIAINDRKPDETPFERIKEFSRWPSPRTFKTHLPYSLLPPQVIEQNCKIIYLYRNPNDTMISLFHNYKSDQHVSYKGSLEKFYHYFWEDRLAYSPYWLHVKEYWEIRDRPNVLAISYEDLRKRFESTVKSIERFIGTSINDDQMKNLASHCSFHKMKHNPMVNCQFEMDLGIYKYNFMRKGVVGDWINFMNDSQFDRAERYAAEHLADLGIPFTYI